MKTYRELYFRGQPTQLGDFLHDIEDYCTNDWCFDKCTLDGSHYITFKYSGKAVDNATVYILFNKNNTDEELRVTQIIPSIGDKIEIEEYNSVLMEFYKDVIEPYKKASSKIDITLSSDIFDPKTVITEKALEELELFWNATNKLTGSTHPYAHDHWMKFICQTVDDDKIFGSDILEKFLKDEDYWGKIDKNFTDVERSNAWNEKHAHKFACDYEKACDLLKYYKRTRGIH